MFDIGASELLVIVIVAVVVIGPKDLPRALRLAGRWIGKIRRTSNHFRAGIEAMIREAEMEEMQKKWAEQNARIMAEHPQVDLSEHEMAPLPPPPPPPPPPSAESAISPAPQPAAPETADDEPQLPLR
jgi:sec-independent protein translocase protein TatB